MAAKYYKELIQAGFRHDNAFIFAAFKAATFLIGLERKEKYAEILKILDIKVTQDVSEVLKKYNEQIKRFGALTHEQLNHLNNLSKE